MYKLAGDKLPQMGRDRSWGALPKTCRDDAGAVLQAETPGKPVVKDAGTVAKLYYQTKSSKQ